MFEAHAREGQLAHVLGMTGFRGEPPAARPNRPMLCVACNRIGNAVFVYDTARERDDLAATDVSLRVYHRGYTHVD